MEGGRCHTLTMTLRDFICVHILHVVCRCSMLNGLIDSREVRRAKAAGSSQSSGAANQQSSRQGTIKDARLQEAIVQRDAYYQKWFTSQQEQMSQHYANVIQQQMQVRLSDSPFSCIETKDNMEYL
jgi:hypothetical protein